VYLSNRLFINRKMIESGLAVVDKTRFYAYRHKFIRAEEKGKK